MLPAESTAEFQDIQSRFAGHLRDPEGCPPPDGVAPDRMAVYQELFFNNMESFLAGGFPVLKSILEGPRWISLVRDFYRDHAARTPLFIGIGAEFVTYLKHERSGDSSDPPFLRDLAHYEWVELDLAVREADPPALHEDRLQSPENCHPFISPVASLLSYDHPVHRIGPLHQPQSSDANPVNLLVYRGRDETIHFLELNPASFDLLKSLDTGDLDLRRRLQVLAQKMGHPAPEKVLQYGCELLLDLHQKGAIGV